jgi:folate-binding protein YgfZ
MNTISQTIDSIEYAALAAGAAVQQRAEAGLLILTDADRSDFLHRMTTNNINALRPGQSMVTVLTSPTARILFVFTVLCREEALWLLPATGEAAALNRHLRGQIFFMDKVKVRDASVEYGQVRVVGPKAGDMLTRLGFALAECADGAWQENDAGLAVKQDCFDLPGYLLIFPAGRQAENMDAMVSSGATLFTGADAYEVRRIELGRPAPGHELTGDYNPLEAGLAWACADNKGCYTGQEILARQVTYDKVTKSLAGLRSAKPLPVGAPVLVAGQTVGAVTSAAFSPTLRASIALAILKRPHNTAGVQVTVEGVAAEVAALPFVSA